MRHPFAGILGLADHLQASYLREGPDAASSRRTALKVLLAGVGTSLASGGGLSSSVLAAEEPAAGSAAAAPAYGAYVVVPRDFRTFRADRRHALGVQGDYYRGEAESKNLRGQSGFLAWLTPEAVKKVAAANDVADVILLEADDKPGPGTRKVPTKELRVLVVPGGWKMRPDGGTFTSTVKLIEQWSKQLGSPKSEKKPEGTKPGEQKPDDKDSKDEGTSRDVTFKTGENDGAVLVEVGEGAPPKDLLARLKEHPQVVAIEWKYVAATTEAVGEEGGATTFALGEEGGVTTKALGEEGGPSTRGLGEEGGPSTLRVGEEGGGSTERLGEEGGVSTKALGEEGGVSTKALGEEGGVTTMALGEEGGPKPKGTGPVK